MTRVLLVGLKPEAVDYSDPALPPGMNVERRRRTGSRPAPGQGPAWASFFGATSVCAWSAGSNLSIAEP
jgi:hypothetical protein